MSRNSGEGAMVAAGVCGGFTVVILICLFIFGVPMFFAGVLMVSFWSAINSVKVAGIIILVIACLLIFSGIVTGILTCVFAVKASSVGNTDGFVVSSNQTAVVLAPVPSGTTVFTTQGNVYPPTQAPPPYPGAWQETGLPQPINNWSQQPQTGLQNYGQPQPAYPKPPPYEYNPAYSQEQPPQPIQPVPVSNTQYPGAS